MSDEQDQIGLENMLKEMAKELGPLYKNKLVVGRNDPEGLLEYRLSRIIFKSDTFNCFGDLPFKSVFEIVNHPEKGKYRVIVAVCELFYKKLEVFLNDKDQKAEEIARKHLDNYVKEHDFVIGYHLARERRL